MQANLVENWFERQQQRRTPVEVWLWMYFLMQGDAIHGPAAIEVLTELVGAYRVEGRA
jgi:hypothetical protein